MAVGLPPASIFYIEVFYMIVAIFGKPGSGKSTGAAAVVHKNNVKKEKYYTKFEKSKLFLKLSTEKTYKNKFINKVISGFKFILLNILYSKNFYDVCYCTDSTIQGTVPCDYENLGKWKPAWNSLIILEEAGIGLNSRDYKKLTSESKRLAAMHRHSGCDMLIISQSADFDKAYRQRAEVMFIAKKIGPFTWYHRIPYDITIDEEKHDIVEGYFKLKPIVDIFETLGSLRKSYRYSKFPFTRSHIIYRPAWYKYFDSYVDDFQYPQLAPDKIIEQKNENSETRDTVAQDTEDFKKIIETYFNEEKTA